MADKPDNPRSTCDTVRVVMSGPPGPESVHFVELEDCNGSSRVPGGYSELPQRPGGWWELVIKVAEYEAEVRAKVSEPGVAADGGDHRAKRRGST